MNCLFVLIKKEQKENYPNWLNLSNVSISMCFVMNSLTLDWKKLHKLSCVYVNSLYVAPTLASQQVSL